MAATSTSTRKIVEPEEVAEMVASALELHTRDEDGARFSFVDWNDLGEVTVQFRGRTFRMTVDDITEG